LGDAVPLVPMPLVKIELADVESEIIEAVNPARWWIGF